MTRTLRQLNGPVPSQRIPEGIIDNEGSWLPTFVSFCRPSAEVSALGFRCVFPAYIETAPAWTAGS